MTTRFIEIMVGLFVVLGFLALFMLAMKVSNLSRISSKEGYEVSAYFENIGGLKVRSPVTVSGVRVGQITEIVYDSNRYEAKVVMRIQAAHDYFPIDTTASIYTAGLLGEQYVALEPGAEEDVLTTGGTIEFTQSALVLEEIIGKIVVKLTSE
ncbi:MAG: outer membrane lipid asymmetry maintenance protein MlaD [Gammaproteobacteria bacterium]|nr:outer membrane lipid asymmetry maintenance protein MlaD [Gammaproteobacteria bacterium]NNC67818.1 outer membrane lipid asymmetry maintenance protein MlaD [Gammaproteobacteria bacterium]